MTRRLCGAGWRDLAEISARSPRRGMARSWQDLAPRSRQDLAPRLPRRNRRVARRRRPSATRDTRRTRPCTPSGAALAMPLAQSPGRRPAERARASPPAIGAATTAMITRARSQFGPRPRALIITIARARLGEVRRSQLRDEWVYHIRRRVTSAEQRHAQRLRERARRGRGVRADGHSRAVVGRGEGGGRRACGLGVDGTCGGDDACRVIAA